VALEPAGVTFVAENLDSYIRDLDNADEAQQGLGDSAEKSSKGLDILGGVVTGVAMAVTTFAIDAVMKASQALVGLAQDSIGVATEFESSMAVLGIAASSTGLQMDELSEAALAVGGDTRLLGVSASGAAESMTGLFKAGLTSQEVFGDLQGYMDGTAQLGGTLRASIDLAAASSLDMVQASDLAAITLATFGHEAEAAGMSTDEWIVQAMDNLVRTADASVAEVEGLQGAMQTVGPTAAAFGFSMADVNTSLAILSTRGIQGSEAGTALKSMFTNMMRPTAEVTGALDELGVVLYDNNGVMLSIPEIMGQFEVAMESLTDEQKNQYIQTIAGTYGMKTMQTLLGEGIEGWIGMEEAIGDAATMMEQGAAKAETYAAKQEALDGVIETLKIKIGSALLPALSGITDAFAEIVDVYGPLLIDAFENIGSTISEALPQAIEGVMSLLSGDFQGAMWDFATVISEVFGRDAAVSFIDFAESFGEFVTHLENFGRYVAIVIEDGDALNDFLVNLPPAIQPVIQAFGENLAEALETAGQVIQFVTDHSEEIIGAIIGIGAALTVAAIAAQVGEIAKALTSLTSPIGIILGLISLLGAAWAGNWGGIRDIVMEILPVVQEFGQMLAERLEPFIAEVGPQIMEILQQLGTAFTSVFGSIFEVIVDSVVPALQDTWETFQETWAIISEILSELGIETEGFSSVVELMAAIVTTAITLLGFVISGVLTAISGTVSFFAEHFQDIWGGILDVIQGVKEWFEGFKQFWTSLFEGDLPGALEGLEDAFSGIAKFIDGMVTIIVKSITMPFEGLYKLLEGFVEGVIKFFENLKKKLVGSSIITDMMDDIEKVIEKVLDAILKVWEEIFEEILDATEDIFESIERIVDRVMTAIERIIDTICTAIGGDWEDFVDLLFELWEETWDNIRNFVDTVFNAIEALIDRIAGTIESLWESFTGTLEEVWENVWNAIDNFVDTTFNAIEQLIDTISGNIQRAWETFTGAVQEVWETIWGAIETFVDTTFGNIETFINTVSGNIETAWNTFTGNVLSVWEGIWDDIDTKIREIWGAIETFISTGIQNIVAFFTDAAQNMIDAGAGIVDNIRQGIENTWQSILDYVSYGLTGESGSIISQIIAALATIKERAKEIVTAIRDGITEVWDNITGRIGALIEGTGGYSGIMQAVTDAWESIKALGGGIVTAIKDGLTALWYTVTDALGVKFVGLGAEGTFGMEIWSAVSELGEKIVNMIKSGLTTLWDATTGVVGALEDKLEALKDALGSLTWSQVAEIGEKVVDWIKEGITSGWYAFVEWLKSMILGIFGSGATEAMQATGERGGRILMESIADGIYANAGVVVDALEQAMIGAEQTGDWAGAMTPENIEADIMQAASGFSASLGMIAPVMMAPAAVSSSTEVNIGPVAINNGMDMAEFEVRVRQAVAEAI
jgi:TP901 family phage tail tape measure protein